MDTHRSTSQWWIQLSALLAYMLIYVVLTVAATGVDISVNFDDKAVVHSYKIMQGIGMILLFAVPAVLFAVIWTKDKLSFIGIDKLASYGVTLVASIGMILALPLINYLATLNESMVLPDFLEEVQVWMIQSEEQAKQILEAFTAGTTLEDLLMNIIVIALIAAVSEELFFRGVLQNVLIKCLNNHHLAIWIGAIFFSAFHMQFFGFLPRMLMGAYLGYLFFWTGSLWPSIMAHFVNNAAAVYIDWLVKKGAIADDIENVGSTSNEWIQVILAVVLVITCLKYIYNNKAVATKG